MSHMVRSYTVGEIPFDTVYEFLDHDGTPIDVSGWTAEQRTVDPGGTETVHSATVTNGPAGEVTVQWQADMTDVPGVYTAHIWVEQAPYKLASTQLVWVVRNTN